MKLKLPSIGFGGALVITELIFIITALLLLTTISSCTKWWVFVSCAGSLVWLFFWCSGFGYLFWAILTDGHAPHEETLQAPRHGVQNSHFFH